MLKLSADSDPLTCSGTTLVYLATDAYNAYMQAIGANFDQISGLLSIPAQDGALENIPDLVFTIPGSERQMVMNNCPFALS